MDCDWIIMGAKLQLCVLMLFLLSPPFLIWDNITLRHRATENTTGIHLKAAFFPPFYFNAHEAWPVKNRLQQQYLRLLL